MSKRLILGSFFAVVSQLTLTCYANAEAAVPVSGIPSAMQEVRATIDEVIQIVEALPGNDKAKERREKLREVIKPRFDFDEMSRRSLGSYWTEITPAQQQEFITLFSDLLARTYLNRIDRVERGMVKFDDEKVEFPKAYVKTSVTSKGDVFPIEYRLMSESGKWRVYDVVIENIGLVTNYRTEFAGIIRKEGFEGLIAKLKEKNRAGA